jgi:3-oxoacyl-[acyl-carrier protein] reductase
MANHKLAGRVALITGGARGIGRAVALRFAAEGAAVAVNYRNRADAAEEVVELIRKSGGKAMAVAADVADRRAVEAMAAEVSAELGPAGILVNNAGVLHVSRLLDYDEAKFEEMWRVNVKGVVHCSAAVAPGMIAGKNGRIVNLSSNAALGTSVGGTTLYAATKGAVLTLTKRFALELGEHGITVNAVLPGFTATDMVLSGKTPDEIRAIHETISAKSMLRRTGLPEDIANVVAFLASEESSFMTGQALLADGGRIDYLAHSA